jgi:hypothetical protein
MKILRLQPCQQATDGMRLSGRDEPVNASFQF